MCAVKALEVYIGLGRALNITDADLKYVKELVLNSPCDAKGEERIREYEEKIASDQAAVTNHSKVDISSEESLSELENYYSETNDAIMQINPMRQMNTKE